MLGAETPDLATTPCPACGERVDAAEAVWDAWQTADPRLAALPYHPACAAPLLPPAEPAPEHLRCAICGENLATGIREEAFAALHARFRAAQGRVVTPQVVWRLAQREPARVYVAEHFACLLGKVERTRTRRAPREEELPGLPPG